MARWCAATALLILGCRGPPGPAGPPGSATGGQGVLSGAATLIGLGPDAGIHVSVVGTNFAADTAADGTYAISGIPTGIYTVDYTLPPFWAELPAVVVMPTGDFLIDQIVFPLDTVELELGQRLQSGAYVTLPILSADNTRAIYIAQDPFAGLENLYLIDLKARTSTLLGRGVVPTGAFSADGEWIWIEQEGALGPVLVVQEISPTVGLPITLTASYTFGTAVWSPFGHALVYADNQQTESFWDGPQAMPRALIPGATGPAIWAPQGDRVLVAVFQNGFVNLGLLPVNGGPFVPLSNGVSFVSQAGLSPDGRIAVFLDGSGTLRAVPTAQPDAGVVLDAPVTAFQISPDSQTLAWAVSGNLPGVKVVPLPALAPARFAEPDGAAFSYSPDGAELLVVEGTLVGQSLVAAPLDGGPPVLLTGDAGAISWQLADGGSLIFSDANADLFATTLAGGSPRVIARQVSGALLSPDGNRVAYRGSLGSEVAVFSVGFSGGTPLPLVRQASPAAWSSADELLTARSNSPAPFPFEDGLYVSTVP